MISAIRQFLNDLAATDEPETLSDDEYRLAAAALLYHVAAIDGDVTTEERERLRSVLAHRYRLDEAETDALVEAAETADKEAVDLYGFTSTLKRRLDEAGREKIIGLMWELVYADGEVHAFEDNLVWRVAELLGVSSRARIRLKQAVRADAGE